MSKFLATIPRTRVTTLSSGVRVATQCVPTFNSATCGVWVAGGSAYDAKEAHGTAHFLEHMAFKGSAGWPSQRRLEVAVESMGVKMHAFTSREETCYLALAATPESAAEASRVLLDLSLRPRHEAYKVEMEKSTIVREMEEVAKQPIEVVFDDLHELAFGKDEPFGRNILGTEASVRRMTKADLQRHLRRWYVPSRIVVAAAGRVSHERMVRLVEDSSYFRSATGAHSPGLPQLRPPQARYTRSLGFACGSAASGMDTGSSLAADPLCYAAIGTYADGANHRNRAVWLVMQALIGNCRTENPLLRSAGGASGLDKGRGSGITPFVGKAVVDGKLAEAVQGMYVPYAECGLFGVYFAAQRSKVARCCDAVREEWERLATRVSEDEVAHAKAVARDGVLMGEYDSACSLCESVGKSVLTAGRHTSPRSWWDSFNRVNAAAVRRLARGYLLRNPPVYAAIGPDMQEALALGKVPSRKYIQDLFPHNTKRK